MLGTLITKELKSILLSPRFTVTFTVCALLVLLSVFLGIQEYNGDVNRYNQAKQLIDQEMTESSSWMGVDNRVFRQPDPMQIFVSGIHYDIGRFSDVSAWNEVKLRRSYYSDETIFAVFRYIDFAFIVQIVLSLLAILFTYDAISGERELGTLKLSMANAVPRVHYVMAKFIGSWLGLIIPLAIPVLLGILLVMLYNVPFTTDHWAQLAALMVISVLFFSLFVVIGIMVSALTRNSSISFLILLVFWTFMVLIMPRASVMLASQIVPAPSVAEIESQQAGFDKQRWSQYEKQLEDRYSERESEMEGMTEEERASYRDDQMWGWMEQEEALRKEVRKDISEHARKLNEDLRNRQQEQQVLAFTLSRLSPLTAFQLAAMSLSGNDVTIKARYEDAMQSYRDNFVEFVDRKREESGGQEGFRISVDNSGIQIDTGDDISLDLSEMPQFEQPRVALAEMISRTTTDFTLLVTYILLGVALTFIRFMKYDVR